MTSLNYVKRMFDDYVAPKFPNKIFDETKIVEKIGEHNGVGYYQGMILTGPPDSHYLYNHDGVIIKIYRRFTTYKGDADIFTDEFVKVDNYIILDEKYD